MTSFCVIFLSFSIHFEICQFSARKQIWSLKTFKAHSLVINSHPKHPDIAYFRSYQGISVSIGINAKCNQSVTLNRLMTV